MSLNYLSRSRIRVRRNSLLHRARKRGVIALRNRSITPQLKERRGEGGMENFSYLVEDVACRLFALVFYLVYTKFHLLRIRETSAACFLTWIRFLMFGLVCTNRFEKSITSFSREDNDFCAIETHAEITFHGYFHF